MSSVTKITDGTLLEYSPDGKVILSDEWNRVMSTIKQAINNNAMVLSGSGITYYITEIASSANVVAPLKWAVEDTTKDPYQLFATIFSTTHNLAGNMLVRLFAINEVSESLEEVCGSITISTEKDITIRSRIDRPLVVIIQGAGA